jgi:hypothetical protein
MVMGSTIDATDDTEDLDLNFCGTPIAAPGVWYLLDGEGSGVRVSTCSDATEYDTALSIFSMSSDGESMQCIGGGDNDQRCIARPKSSSVAFFAESGVSYYILVHGTNSEVGFFGLTATAFDRVENDVCDSAIPISDDGSLVKGSTWMASIDQANVFHCGAFVGLKAGVWYRAVGTGETFTATTCSPETDFNTAVSIFKGSCGGFDSLHLQCVAGNDDDYVCAGQFGTSTVSWPTLEGEVYYILVHASYFSDLEAMFLSAYGEFGLTLNAA